MKTLSIFWLILSLVGKTYAQEKPVTTTPKDTTKTTYKSESFEWHTEGGTVMLSPAIRQSVTDFAKSLGWKEDELVVSITVKNKFEQVPNQKSTSPAKSKKPKAKKFE